MTLRPIRPALASLAFATLPFASLPFLSLALALLPFALGGSQEGSPTQEVRHRVALHGDGELRVIAADGSLEWSMPWKEARDLHALPNGNLMTTRGQNEVVEIERITKSVVWSYDAGAQADIHAFDVLANGNVWIAEDQTSRLIEVDRLGDVVRTIDIEEKRREPMSGLRAFDDGTVLVTLEGIDVYREYQPDGQALRDVAVPNINQEPHSGPITWRCRDVARDANGTTWVANGLDFSLIGFDPEGATAYAFRRTSLPGVELGCVLTVEALSSGQVLITNAENEHRKVAAIQIDPERGRAVWTLPLGGAVPNDTTQIVVLDDGPDGAILARAQRLHREALTLDTHKDIRATLATPVTETDPAKALELRRRDDPTVWGRHQVDFPKMRAGGLDVAFYIVYVGQGSLDEAGFAQAREAALAKFEAIERMARLHPEHIEIARSPDDVERIARAGKLVACIGIENGYAMGTDLGAIEEFHRRGARYMSLTHNRHSQLGDSNTPEDEVLYGGLSELGRRAVLEMNRVGIMVDVSHAAETTTLQAIELSKAPVMASHSGVDAVRLHGRNLSEAELQALKANGGVIQCVAFASYVKSDDDRQAFIAATREELGLPPQRGRRVVDDSPETRRKLKELRDRMRAFDATYAAANVADFVDHIDHAVRVIGIDHVAISSDFDGGGGVEGWNDASQTFEVTLELVRRGYSDADVHKLWSGNTLRVWREVERVAAELEGR